MTEAGPKNRSVEIPGDHNLLEVTGLSQDLLRQHADRISMLFNSHGLGFVPLSDGFMLLAYPTFSDAHIELLLVAFKNLERIGFELEVKTYNSPW